MKHWIWILAGVTLLGGCGSGAAAEPDAAEPVLAVQTTKSTTQTVRDLLPIEGSYLMSPDDMATLAPTVGGKLAQVYVKQGDRVKKGQLLARIDTSVLAAQSSSAALGSATAASEAQQARADLAASKAEYEASVKAAQLNLETAKASRDAAVTDAANELAKLKAGSRPQEIEQAKQAVRQAQVERDQAKVNSDRDQRLLKDGYVSGQQADASLAAYQVAESALESAKQQLEIVQQGPRKEELQAAEAKLRSAKVLGDKEVASAQAALVQAQQGKLSLDAKSQGVKAAELAASQKSADSAAASGSLLQGEIRAPYDGSIVERLLGPGDMADATTPVFRIAKAGVHPEFVGQVSPHDASRVKTGQGFLADGLDTQLGVVKAVGIANMMSDQVPIRVELTNPPPGTVAGGFGKGAVVLRTIPGAVVVPQEALVSRDDKTIVFVVQDGTAKMTDVEIGPTDKGMVLIKSGLQSGETVILVGQHELSDGAKVKEETPAGAQ